MTRCSPVPISTISEFSEASAWKCCVKLLAYDYICMFFLSFNNASLDSQKSGGEGKQHRPEKAKVLLEMRNVQFRHRKLL